MSGALSWINQALGSTVSLSSGTAPGGSSAIDSAYPASNAVNTDPSRVCRVTFSTGLTVNSDQRLTANWSTNRTIRTVALINCRFGTETPGDISVILLNAAGTTVWSTSFTRADLTAIPGDTDRYNLFFITPAVSAARLRVQVLHPSSSTSGSWDVGVMWAGDGLVFARGLGAEWATGVQDQSIVERGNSGGYASYAYNTLDALSISKRGLEQAEGLGDASTVNSLRHMMRIAGRHSPVVVISSDDTTARAQTMSVYGLIEEASPISANGRGDRFGTAMRVVEIR